MIKRVLCEIVTTPESYACQASEEHMYYFGYFVKQGVAQQCRNMSACRASQGPHCSSDMPVLRPGMGMSAI